MPFSNAVTSASWYRSSTASVGSPRYVPMPTEETTPGPNRRKYVRPKLSPKRFR
jgi:hypothetical protein